MVFTCQHRSLSTAKSHVPSSPTMTSLVSSSESQVTMTLSLRTALDDYPANGAGQATLNLLGSTTQARPPLTTTLDHTA